MLPCSSLLHLIQQLQSPELCFEERLGIASQLREALGRVNEHTSPMGIQEDTILQCSHIRSMDTSFS